MVERNFAEFCNTFAQYSRKVAKVRDRGDAIAQTALAYSESENINKSLAHGLENFANSITTISDYGDLRVQTIDKKVVQEFSLYESICKQAKDEVKYIFNARDKELSRKKQLDRTRERNPRNRQLIVSSSYSIFSPVNNQMT